MLRAVREPFWQKGGGAVQEEPGMGVQSGSEGSGTGELSGSGHERRGGDAGGNEEARLQASTDPRGARQREQQVWAQPGQAR